ncbi:MAG: Lipopolysaccharide heptosyltransferase 1 [Chlamydiales bacterium]|nr:Lipopolysaccharide heptosyltransferase 1 [Chlamydiales bacterium]
MKILIVKTSSLGDLIHTFPVIDYLYRRFEGVQIDWVVEGAFAELIRAHPLVTRVLTIESKKWRKNPFKYRGELRSFSKKLREVKYDCLFDLQGNLKSSGVVVQARAKQKVGFGWKTVPEWPNVLFTKKRFNSLSGSNIRDDYLSIVKNYFKDDLLFEPRSWSLKLNSIEQQKLAALFDKNQSPTLVCPSSAWSNKCLTKQSLIEVLHSLNRAPYWFTWGSPQEREIAVYLSSHFQNSAVLERLSIPLLQHVMAKSSLVISMDSLPLHLCGTTDTPSLSFFGPSSAQKYKPMGDQHVAIQGECPYAELFEKRCSKLRTCSTGSCLRGRSGFAEDKKLSQFKLHTCEKL